MDKSTVLSSLAAISSKVCEGELQVKGGDIQSALGSLAQALIMIADLGSKVFEEKE